jgi:hypothetical protein
MLPGDDELVIYGEDGTVSVSKSLPKEDQSLRLEAVEALREAGSGGGSEGKVCGALVTYRKVKATKYLLKNNAPAGTAPKRLYIDHTADSAHDGYVPAVLFPSAHLPLAQRLTHHLCLTVRLIIDSSGTPSPQRRGR